MKRRIYSNTSGLSNGSPDLTEREKRVLTKIQNDVEARRAFDFFLREIGCSENVLVINLVQDAWGPEAVDDSHELMAPDEIQELPRDLEDLAERIQRANELTEWRFVMPVWELFDERTDSSLAPWKLMPSKQASVRRRQLATAFTELPKTLRTYAHNVESKLQYVDSTRANRKSSELQFTDLLEQWIQEKTGRPYRDRLTAILRVTYPLAGRKPPASGETLRKRDVRKKKKAR